MHKEKREEKELEVCALPREDALVGRESSSVSTPSMTTAPRLSLRVCRYDPSNEALSWGRRVSN